MTLITIPGLRKSFREVVAVDKVTMEIAGGRVLRLLLNVIAAIAHILDPLSRTENDGHEAVSKGRTLRYGVRYTRKKLPFALPSGGVKRDSWDTNSFKTTNLTRQFLRRRSTIVSLKACPFSYTLIRLCKQDRLSVFP